MGCVTDRLLLITAGLTGSNAPLFPYQPPDLQYLKLPIVVVAPAERHHLPSHEWKDHMTVTSPCCPRKDLQEYYCSNVHNNDSKGNEMILLCSEIILNHLMKHFLVTSFSSKTLPW